jgi:tRNA(His) 5'-end guanylyltransferase
MDSLGDRMKRIELASEYYLTRRIPVLVRCDGSCFHSWTRGLGRPFDDNLRTCMEYATYRLCKEIEGARFAYTQSDEITVLLVDYQTLGTESWFDLRVQKMTSVAASICTAAFAVACLKCLPEHLKKRGFAKFDARVYTVPKEDVSNAFLWRMQDCVRNSIQAIGQANFSQKQLHGKSCDEIQDMLFKEKGINWNDTPTRYKRGVGFYKSKIRLEVLNSHKNPEAKDEVTYRNKWVKDYEMPIITQDPEYINKWIVEEPIYLDRLENNEIICEDITL